MPNQSVSGAVFFFFSGEVVFVSGISDAGQKDGSDEKKSICGKAKKIFSLLLLLLLCVENSKLEKEDDLSKISLFECKTESSRNFDESSLPIFSFPPLPKQYDVSQSFLNSRKKPGEDEEKEGEKIWIVETGRPIAF